MAKGDKYIALTAYLEKCGQDVVKMSFNDIERVLGDKLPKSAYVHTAFWANTESHSFAFGWRNAGYLSRNLNLEKQTIEFVKKEN